MPDAITEAFASRVLASIQASQDASHGNHNVQVFKDNSSVILEILESPKTCLLDYIRQRSPLGPIPKLNFSKTAAGRFVLVVADDKHPANYELLINNVVFSATNTRIVHIQLQPTFGYKWSDMLKPAEALCSVDIPQAMFM